MIDGGLIANSPALIAYEMATQLNKKKNIRMLSLGTGLGPAQKIDTKDWSKLSMLKVAGDFAVDIDVFCTDKILTMVFKK